MIEKTTQTTTKEALEPPDRIWIEGNDSSRYYTHPPKFSKGIEYSRVSAPIVAPVADIQELQRRANDLPAACEHGNLDPRDVDRLIEGIVAAPASTVAPQQFDAKWDKSGLKEACQRGLAMGRYRQEFDLQLLLDMLLEIERLEPAVTETHG